MSKFPVELSDDEGQIDAINYLLSGPSGLGQNFSGFTTFSTGYLTGNFRIPFTQVNTAQLYVAPINLGNAELLDDRTIKYTFTSAQATVPFSVGNGLVVTGVTPIEWNNSYLRPNGYNTVPIGVVECTTTYVIVRTIAPIPSPLPAYVSGGTIEYSSMDALNSTDCDVRVTVEGGTDRVFISGQLNQVISYEVFSGSEDLTVYVDLSRYTAFINNDPVNPDYIFDDVYIVAEKVYEFPGLTGTGSLPLLETVFATILDEPDPGYYRYIVEVYFTASGSMQVTTDEFTLRSISAQVVKQ